VDSPRCSVWGAGSRAPRRRSSIPSPADSGATADVCRTHAISRKTKSEWHSGIAKRQNGATLPHNTSWETCTPQEACYTAALAAQGCKAVKRRGLEPASLATRVIALLHLLSVLFLGFSPSPTTVNDHQFWISQSSDNHGLSSPASGEVAYRLALILLLGAIIVPQAVSELPPRSKALEVREGAVFTEEYVQTAVFS